MLEMPVLKTKRLMIRPFTLDDLADAYRLFDVDLQDTNLHSEKMTCEAERQEWLKWSVLNYHHLALLNQPPYGDRALVLRENGQLIGSCGFVPCLNAFEQLPYFAAPGAPVDPGRYSPEFGLFYAVSPAHRRRGFAVEAAQALVDYAFQQLHVRRVIATTDYDNAGSIGVMHGLGMHIEANPLSEPPWLQVVGIIENMKG